VKKRIALALLLSTAFAAAQDQQLTVRALITDKKHHPLTNPFVADQIKIDGPRQLAIGSVSRLGRRKLALLVLCDTSNSMQEIKTKVRQQVAGFVDTIMKPGDEAAVVGFDSSVYKATQNFTRDPQEVTEAINSLHSGGATALYDALELSSRVLAAGPAGFERMVLLVSDGGDNQSRMTREEAVAALQRAQVHVFAINVNDDDKDARSDATLNRITRSTTGWSIRDPDGKKDLSAELTAISDALDSEYEVGISGSVEGVSHLKLSFPSIKDVQAVELLFPR
jgi:VWFA-related protein